MLILLNLICVSICMFVIGHWNAYKNLGHKIRTDVHLAAWLVWGAAFALTFLMATTP